MPASNVLRPPLKPAIVGSVFSSAFQPVVDDAVAAWATAVGVAGGSVSETRASLVSAFVDTLRTIGWWSVMDDAALLVAENAGQALVTLKRRALMTAVNTPTFTADTGYAFNGTTQYINTGFIPGTHAQYMTGGSARLELYERTNVGSTSMAMGCGGAVNNALWLRPRNAADATLAAVGSASTTFTGSVTDSRGYHAASKSSAVNPADISAQYNDTHRTPVSATTLATLQALSIYIGGRNVADALSSGRASTIGYAGWGAAITDAQGTAVRAAVQTFMTAVGANV